MSVRFLHVADLHLDSPLIGLDRYPGAPAGELRAATRAALANLTDTALRERVDFVVVVGVLYDGDWTDFNTGLFFRAQMGLLRDAGIPVFVVRGNHDAESQITRTLTQPDNVCEFASDRPSTRVLEHLGVAVHGQSFRHRATADDLAAGYPDAVPGLWLAALAGSAGMLWLAANARAVEIAGLAATLVVGAGLYAARTRARRAAVPDAQ